MASTLATMKLFANMAIASYDHDPDTTDATVLGGSAAEIYVDLRDYAKFGVVAMSSALTGNGITKLEIVASATTDFASVTVVKDSGTVAADAVGDFVVEECTADEVKVLGDTLRYVAARITVQNAADEAVVTYVAADPRFAYSGLTADTIA